MYPAPQPRKEAMQIQFKQVEITAAIKQYITKQGIDLVGKTVDIVFTAGRKKAGLSADISIEDLAIPGTDNADEEVVKTASVLGLVKPVMNAVAAIAIPETDKAIEARVAQAQYVTTAMPEKSPVSSLFGS